MKVSSSRRLMAANLLLALAILAAGCGGGGGGGGDTGPTEPVQVNNPPVALAGSDQNVAIGASVMLDGSASSDPDGDLLSYSWTLNAPGGSAANLTGANTATPSFTADTAGQFRATLVVGDGQDSSNPSMVMVTVEEDAPVNESPVISGLDAEYISPALSRVRLEVQTFDPNGDPVTTTWQQTSGPSLWSTNPTGNAVEIELPADNGSDQRFRIRVTASDGELTDDIATEILVPTSVAPVVSDDTEYEADDELPPEMNSAVEISPDTINAVGIYEASQGEFSFGVSSTAGTELQGPVLATLFSEAGDGQTTATDVAEYFVLDNQQSKYAVDPDDLPDFHALLGEGFNELVISARDSAGAEFSQTARFYFGFGRISGQLTSPAGLPYTGLGGQVINLWGSFKGITKQAIVQPNGEFEFNDLPADTYNLQLLTGDIKLANASMRIHANGDVATPKPVVVDLGELSGNSAEESTSLSALPSATNAATPERAAAHQEAIARRADRFGKPKLANTTRFGAVSVMSDAQGVSVNGQQAVTIPSGVDRVKIVATVESDEFPSFTTFQSQFNDAWQFGHVAGQKVVSKQGNVNSSHASSGTISFSELYDVAPGTNKIVLFASATNIGDGSFPTEVTVEVYAATSDDLTVGKFQHTEGLGFGDGRWHIGVETNSSRQWTGQIQFMPADASVQSAACSFITADGEYPVNLVTVSPTGAGRANVEMGFSGLASVPAAATHGKVACQFEGINAAGDFVDTDDVVSMEMAAGKDDLVPLTRHLTGQRFGVRDIGGDSWMRFGTRGYMAALGSTLVFNDASREHGGCFVNDGSYASYNTAASASCTKSIRDHNSHRAGTSVDARYPTAYISSKDLNSLVAQAASNPTAAAQVATWVTNSRNGIDAITASLVVKKVYIAKAEWLYKLLVNGTDVNDQPIAGLQPWVTMSPKVVPYKGHRSHIHIEFRS